MQRRYASSTKGVATRAKHNARRIFLSEGHVVYVPAEARAYLLAMRDEHRAQQREKLAADEDALLKDFRKRESVTA